MANFVPPRRSQLRPGDDWPRGGLKGFMFGALLGSVASAVLYWLTGSPWCFVGILPIAWILFAVRHPPRDGKCRISGTPPNVLW